MTRLEALDTLLEKVKAGECNFDWGFATSPSRKALPVGWHEAMNAFNGSTDAALALIKSVLPGWGWSYYSSDGHCILGSPDPLIYAEAHHHTPARALLIACLEALKAKEEADD